MGQRVAQQYNFPDLNSETISLASPLYCLHGATRSGYGIASDTRGSALAIRQHCCVFVRCNTAIVGIHTLLLLRAAADFEQAGLRRCCDLLASVTFFWYRLRRSREFLRSRTALSWSVTWSLSLFFFLDTRFPMVRPAKRIISAGVRVLVFCWRGPGAWPFLLESNPRLLKFAFGPPGLRRICRLAALRILFWFIVPFLHLSTHPHLRMNVAPGCCEWILQDNSIGGLGDL